MYLSGLLIIKLTQVYLLCVLALISNFICSLAFLLLEEHSGKLWEFLCQHGGFLWAQSKWSGIQSRLFVPPELPAGCNPLGESMASRQVLRPGCGICRGCWWLPALRTSSIRSLELQPSLQVTAVVTKLELFWHLWGLSVLPLASWPEIDNFCD